MTTYVESQRDLDDPALGQQARYIYLEDTDRLRRNPAGRVFMQDGNWHGIVYRQRFHQVPVCVSLNRIDCINAILEHQEIR